MKCALKNVPRIEICLMFFFIMRKFKGFFRVRVMATRTREAIVRRQNAREETLRTLRSLMKMADVPNSVPAMKPSVRAVFLLLLDQ